MENEETRAASVESSSFKIVVGEKEQKKIGRGSIFFGFRIDTCRVTQKGSKKMKNY